jgi:hypothetical protein
MDVIASGLEACPSGLAGYGFEPYAAASPGNAVMALASFWADNVQAALAAQERLADRSFQLRYEDLVAGPEAVAAGLFEFLGVAAAPGISQECFSVERERFGPADYKIWYTSAVSSASVGRGWSVPAAMIAPQLLAVINELAGRLGYLPVDGQWGTTEPPADLRVPVTSPSASADGEGPAAPASPAAPAGVQGAGPAADDPAAVGAGGRDDRGDAGPAGTARTQRPVPAAAGGPPCSARLGERLRADLAAAADGWGPHGSERFVAVVVTNDPHRPGEYWHVDLGAAAATLVTEDAQQDSDWDVIATLEIWHKLLDHQVNPSVALRSCALRYCDNGQSTPLAEDTRLAILAQLLGLAHWRQTGAPAS